MGELLSIKAPINGTRLETYP
jgi:hypothetical protein